MPNINDAPLRAAIGVQLCLLAAAMLTWQLWASPPHIVPATLLATIILMPLLALLPGIILARPRVAGVWTPLVLLFYFTWAMTETVANIEERGWAILATLLTIAAFTTSLLYAVRHRRPRQPDQGSS